MKISNTNTKYVNGDTQTLFDVSSADNILVKENKDMLDLELKLLDNDVKAIMNQLAPKHYFIDTSQNSSIGASAFVITIVNNVVYLSGRLVAKQALNGEYKLTLPISCRPKAEYVGNWAPVIIDGVIYRMHLDIHRNSGNELYLFFYDTIPQGASVVTNLCYPLDDEYYAEPQ